MVHQLRQTEINVSPQNQMKPKRRGQAKAKREISPIGFDGA